MKDCSPLNQKKLNYLKNVTSGWRTSLLGIVLIIASISSVFIKDTITWVDAIVGVSLGVGLLFTPDKTIKKNSE